MEISPELQYLSAKRTAMANPATKYDDLYYSRLNSTMALIQSQSVIGKWRQNLSSKEFGSSSTIILPRGNFLGTCFLHLKLPALTASGQSLSRGHLYSAIREISYQVGSSNVNTITISGKSIYHLFMAQGNTSEQMEELLEMGGRGVIYDPAKPETHEPIEGDVIIPLPWSTFNGGQYQKLPFDTAMLSQPIQVTITFQELKNIYGGAHPGTVGFDEAFFYMREEVLVNKELGMAALLKRPENMDMISAYPYVHTQLWQSPNFAGSAPGNEPTILTLQGFLNSDLFGIVLSLHLAEDESNPGGNRPCQPWRSVEAYNLRVEYNGETVYYAPGESYRIHNMASIMGNPAINMFDYVQATPVTAQPYISRCIFVDFSRIRCASFHNHWPNTPKFPNEVLNVYLNTPDSGNYRLYATYLYPGIIETKSDGQVEIYFS